MLILFVQRVGGYVETNILNDVPVMIPREMSWYEVRTDCGQKYFQKYFERFYIIIIDGII